MVTAATTSCPHAQLAPPVGSAWKATALADESGGAISNGLTAADLANYPLACRARFLDATRKGHTAQKHVIDQILDDYNLWLAAFGD